MRKSYKIIIILGVVILFLSSLFIALSSKQAPVNQSSSQNISVPDKNGGAIQIKDFTKNPAETLGDTLVISQSDNFSIVYFKKDQSFLITLLAQPVQKSRDLAEEEFLNKLQISQTNACKLIVSLTVPAAVDEGLAGRDFGLSFCPLGKSFITP